MNYNRSCPGCQQDISYKTVEAYKVAEKKQIKCKTCRIGPDLFFRNCSQCNSVMGYAKEENYLKGMSDNLKCQSCKNPKKFTNCKVCKVELSYTTNSKEYCKKCFKKHRDSLTGERNCPECNSLITYATIYDKKKGDLLNTVCEKCSHKKQSLTRMGNTAHTLRVNKGMSEEESLAIWVKSEAQRKEKRKGYVHTQETLDKIQKSRFKLYNVAGLDCQGNWEKHYIEKLILENKILPFKALKVVTPIGSYIPDFEYSDRYIEIKSTHTYDIFQKKYNAFGGQISLQKDKIEWVGTNVKPVQLLVLDKDANIIIEEWYTPSGVKRIIPSF